MLKRKTSPEISNSTFLEFIGVKKKKLPNGFWKDIDNHKKYVLWLGKKLGYKTMEDWYKICQKDFSKNGGGTFLKYYKRSPSNALKHVFPEYNWLEWKFEQAPTGFWNNIENCKKYLLWLGKTLGYTSMEDWYEISMKNFKDNYGSGLISNYNIKSHESSYINIIINTFTDYNWLEWKFKNLFFYWNNIENCKRYMVWLKQQIGYETIEDWYKISNKVFKNNYGGGLLRYYKGSPISVIKSLFPEYNWLEWKFNTAPQNFWDNIENQRRYLLWLGKKLGYTNMKDWYKICKFNIESNYGYGLLEKYNNCYSKAIMTIFPEYKWEKSKFNNFKTEKKLYDELLKNKVELHIKKIKLHYRPEWANLRKTHNTYYEYDIYIELTNGVKIIIEVDGAQHYIQVPKWNTPLHNQIRDEIKQRLAKKNGVNVLRISQENALEDKNDWQSDIINFINRKFENNNVIDIYDCASIYF